MWPLQKNCFFRGLLQYELLAYFPEKKTVVIVTINVLFGILRLINMSTYATPIYAVVQGICAFCVGTALSAMLYFYGNLSACIIVHALINITSIFSDDGGLLGLNIFEGVVYLIVALVYLIIGYTFLRDDTRRKINEVIY